MEKLLTFEHVEALKARFNIHATYDVYRECARRGWTALMGDRRATFVHKNKGKKKDQKKMRNLARVPFLIQV